jgi:hypothetical protein
VIVSAPGHKVTNKGTLTVAAGGGGSRLLIGALVNQKTLDLGSATLQLSGSYSQTNAGTFKTFIDSLATFGKLDAAFNSAALGGTVSISRRKAFVPSPGDQFEVLTAGSLAGAWTKSLGAVIQGAKYFLPTYGTSAVLIVKVASISLSPASGPPGTSVTVTGSDYPPNDTVTVRFKDAAKVTKTLGTATTDATGAFSKAFVIPATAAPGAGTLTATSGFAKVKVSKGFTVT